MCHIRSTAARGKAFERLVLEFRVEGTGCWVPGFEFRVSGSEFWVPGFGLTDDDAGTGPSPCLAAWLYWCGATVLVGLIAA